MRRGRLGVWTRLWLSALLLGGAAMLAAPLLGLGWGEAARACDATGGSWDARAGTCTPSDSPLSGAAL